MHIRLKPRARACTFVAAGFLFASAGWAAEGELAPSGRWTAQPPGAAPTPPMGWNSWNAFKTDITEEKVMGAAQALVDTGLARLGYVYVNIDDGWWLKRRQADGRMQIRTNLFPSARTGGPEETSFRPFVDRIHKLGLKAGIYTDIGRNACSQAFDLHSPNLPTGTVPEREVGLEGHLEQDVRLYFGEWGFDFVKIDACGIADFAAGTALMKKAEYRPRDPLIVRRKPDADRSLDVRRLYEQAGEAIRALRPKQDVVMSVCTWGRGDVHAWGHQVGALWRTDSDIRPRWDSMLRSFDSVATRAFYARPGSWNDPDMLFIGAGDFSEQHLTEARSHFSLWAIMNSPLLIGYDLRKAPKALLDIWGKAEVVAINQDKAGHQGTIAWQRDEVQAIVKTLADGRKAVALLNRSASAKEAVLHSEDLRLDGKAPVRLRNLWDGTTLAFTGQAGFRLAPRETLLFVAAGEPLLKDGVYLSEIPARLHVAQERLSGAGSALREGVHADMAPGGAGIAIASRQYRYGVSMLADTRVEVRTDREFSRLRAAVGIDAASAAEAGPVRVSVYGDGRLLHTAMLPATGRQPVELDVDLQGALVVELVADGIDDQAPAATVSWADARLIRRSKSD